MKHYKIMMVLFLVMMVSVVGCGTAIKKLKKAESAYYRGKVATAKKIMLPLQSETNDRDYPIILLSLGSLHLCEGDFYSAERAFQAALNNLEIDLNEVGVAKQVLKSESSRLYRGFSHEKVLAHTYIGLCYMQRGKPDMARIEFAKARDEDKGKEAGQEDDFATSYFLDGLNAFRIEDYRHARVSFRKVVELKSDFGLGWYFLARASLLENDNSESDHAWLKYESLTNEEERLSKDGEAPFVLFMVDVGWGPYRQPVPLVGQFAKWKPCVSRQSEFVFTAHCSKEFSAQSYQLSDQYFQANTAGGFGEDAGKKIVSVAVKETIKHFVPFGGLFVGKSEADTRCWQISPGTIHFVALPVPPRPTTIELKVFDKNLEHIPLYDRVLYYIVGRPSDKFEVIYLRTMPNADYRELQ